MKILEEESMATFLSTSSKKDAYFSCEYAKPDRNKHNKNRIRGFKRRRVKHKTKKDRVLFHKKLLYLPLLLRKIILFNSAGKSNKKKEMVFLYKGAMV